MNDTYDNLELSPLARAHQQAILPDLLRAVKHRRRRRHAVRGLAAATLLAVVVFAVQALWGTRGVAAPEPDRQQVRGPSWTTFRDDATTLTRCAVSTVRRSDWFVDDDGLNALLHESGRRSGIIRAPGLVRVDPAAIDPWPASGAE